MVHTVCDKMMPKWCLYQTKRYRHTL